MDHKIYSVHVPRERSSCEGNYWSAERRDDKPEQACGERSWPEYESRNYSQGHSKIWSVSHTSSCIFLIVDCCCTVTYLGVKASEGGVTADCGRTSGEAAADRKSTHDPKQSSGRAQVQASALHNNISCSYSHSASLFSRNRDERDESNRQVAELRERLQARENDNARESKRREKTQKELQDVRAKFDEEMKVEEQIRSTTPYFTVTLKIIPNPYMRLLSVSFR